jgi:hypothetical protein
MVHESWLWKPELGFKQRDDGVLEHRSFRSHHLWRAPCDVEGKIVLATVLQTITALAGERLSELAVVLIEDGGVWFAYVTFLELNAL